MLFLIGYLKNKYGNDFGMPQVRNLSSQEGKSSNKIYSIKEPAGIMYENEIKGENIHYRFMSEFYPTETIEFTTKVGLNDLEKNLFESKHFIEDEEEINDFLIYDHEEGNYGIKVLENGKIAGVIYKNEQEDSLNSIRKIEQYLDKKLNKNA